MTETIDRPTVEQVRNEPAGRRMDLWFARFVLNLKPPKGAELQPDGTYEHEVYDWEARITTYFSWPPYYSTDNHTSLVALESQKSIQQWQLTRSLNDYCFDAELTTKAVFADTIPLAICRYLLIAALEGTL